MATQEERFEEAENLYYDDNFEKAVPLLEALAKEGHAEAQYILGDCYADGEGVTQNDAKAIEWYKKSAEQGNVDAQLTLGFAYDQGKGVPQDYAKAAEWYRKAVDQGNVEAGAYLADLYFHGDGISQDYAKAFELYSKAAEEELLSAIFGLGICYVKGLGVSEDGVKGVELIKKAAEKGHEGAKQLLKDLNIKSGTSSAKSASKIGIIGAIALAVIIGIIPGFGFFRLIIGAAAGFFIGMLIDKKLINK